MPTTPTNPDVRQTRPTSRRSTRSRCAMPSLRQLRRVMGRRSESFLPNRAHPGTARFSQRIPALRSLRRTCRRRLAGGWCSRLTNFAGSHGTVWRSADRSPGGPTFMPRQAGNGLRRPSRSPPPEPISAAGCCLETLGAESMPAPATGSMHYTAARESISRMEAYQRASKL